MVPFRDHQRRFEVSVSSFQFLGTLFWSHFYSNEGHKTIEVALFHLFLLNHDVMGGKEKAELFLRGTKFVPSGHDEPMTGSFDRKDVILISGKSWLVNDPTFPSLLDDP